MPLTSIPGDGHRPRRQARPGLVRLGPIVAGAFACLLVASSASAWVPTPNRPKSARPAQSTARYVPARSHADPASRDIPFAVILTGGRPTGSSAWLQVRTSRSTVDAAAGSSALSRSSSSDPPRAVSTVPSHWGATHLSV